MRQFDDVLRKFEYPLPPMVIGAVLGPICESNFRRSLVISADDDRIFIGHPISATILAICVVASVLTCLPSRSLRFLKRDSTLTVRPARRRPRGDR